MRIALIVSMLAALPLALPIHSQVGGVTPAGQIVLAVDQVQEAEEAPRYMTAVVERAQLHHMYAEDLSWVLQVQFQGALWTRVEAGRNGVLISGQPEVVARALEIAKHLDVAVEQEQ